MNVLKRVEDAVIDTYAACKVEMAQNRRAYKPWFAGGLACGMAIVMCGIAYAATDVEGLGNNVATAIKSIYKASFGVVTIFAALMALFAFVMRMTANQQKAAQATSWLIRIGIAYAGINAIGLIFSAIAGTVDQGDYGGVDVGP